MGERDSVVATLSGVAVVCISDPLPLTARAQCAKCVETHMRARRLDDVAVVDRLIHGRRTSGVLGGPTSTLQCPQVPCVYGPVRGCDTGNAGVGVL